MKITIITSCLNSEATIFDAVKSVNTQSYKDIEHLVMDGGSNDSTLDVIAAFNCENIHVYSEPDTGIYDALNKGIKHSSGEIVGLMHSDDFYANNQVLNMVASAFSSTGADIVYADLDYVDVEDQTRVLRHWVSGSFHPRKLNRGWMPAHPTIFLRKSVFEQFGLFDDKLSISADYDFILRVFSHPNISVHYIPQVTYKMRAGGISNGSFRSIVSKMFQDHKVIKRNGLAGFTTLFLKNATKIPQFFHRAWWSKTNSKSNL